MNKAIDINNQSKARLSFPLIITVIAYLCAILMLYTAFSKLFAFSKFYNQILSNPVIFLWAGFVAWGVTISELLIGGLLLFEQTRKLGLYLFAGLMTVFTIYIIFLLKVSPVIPCSCAGLEGLTWAQHFWFNIGFIVLAITGIILMKKNRKNSSIESDSI